MAGAIQKLRGRIARHRSLLERLERAYAADGNIDAREKAHLRKVAQQIDELDAALRRQSDDAEPPGEEPVAVSSGDPASSGFGFDGGPSAPGDAPAPGEPPVGGADDAAVLNLKLPEFPEDDGTRSPAQQRLAAVEAAAQRAEAAASEGNEEVALSMAQDADAALSALRALGSPESEALLGQGEAAVARAAQATEAAKQTAEIMAKQTYNQIVAATDQAAIAEDEGDVAAANAAAQTAQTAASALLAQRSSAAQALSRDAADLASVAAAHARNATRNAAQNEHAQFSGGMEEEEDELQMSEPPEDGPDSFGIRFPKMPETEADPVTPEEAVEEAKRQLERASEQAKETADGVWDKLKNTWDDMSGGGGGGGEPKSPEGVVDSATEAAQQAADSIRDAAESVWDALKGAGDGSGGGGGGSGADAET